MKEEDLKYMDFWPRVWRLGANHPDVIQARQIIEETEPAYKAICRKLTEEERDQLILYMGACDAETQGYAVVAYEMGRAEGPRKPNETFRDWVDDPDYWAKVLGV